MSQQHLKLLFVSLGQPLAIVWPRLTGYLGGRVKSPSLPSVASLHPLQPVLDTLSLKAISVPIQFPGTLMALLVLFIETIGRLCVHGRMKGIYAERKRSSVFGSALHGHVRIKAREILIQMWRFSYFLPTLQ